MMSIATQLAMLHISDALARLACIGGPNGMGTTVRCLSHFALQAELEDEILQLLSSATGNLLDNIQLINTLNASKTTWEQVNQSLQVCSYFVMLMRCLHCLHFALTILCSSMRSARLCFFHHQSLCCQCLAVYACQSGAGPFLGTTASSGLDLTCEMCSCICPLELSLL